MSRYSSWKLVSGDVEAGRVSWSRQKYLTDVVVVSDDALCLANGCRAVAGMELPHVGLRAAQGSVRRQGPGPTMLLFLLKFVQQTVREHLQRVTRHNVVGNPISLSKFLITQIYQIGPLSTDHEPSRCKTRSSREMSQHVPNGTAHLTDLACPTQAASNGK